MVQADGPTSRDRGPSDTSFHYEVFGREDGADSTLIGSASATDYMHEGLPPTGHRDYRGVPLRGDHRGDPSNAAGLDPWRRVGPLPSAGARPVSLRRHAPAPRMNWKSRRNPSPRPLPDPEAEPLLPFPEAPSPAPPPAPEAGTAYRDHCPNCGARLLYAGCKYRCPRCHYFMSCSDFD